jgi:hypothetical protein
MFGNILNQNEDLSKLLPKFDGRPFVFVLDQIDIVPMGDDMRVFIKTLAEDSHLTKGYSVLVLCSNALNAKTMWDWNWHEKIDLLSELRGQPPAAYRWEENDVEQWMDEFKEANPSRRDTVQWDLLKDAAVLAGTPGFLVKHALTANANSRYEEWFKCAQCNNELWNSGEKILEY